MRLSRVYVENLPAINSRLILPKETAHYLGNVLRVRLDDEVLLFNGEQGEYLVRVCAVSKKSVEVEICESRRTPGEDSGPKQLSISLMLGLSRGDRMDLAVQKSTELGVDKIIPVYTEFSESKLKADRAEKKLQHWRRIAISACEQCGRLSIPFIHSPVLLSELPLGKTGNKWMLEPRGSDSLPSAIEQNEIELLVGPEGGFSSTEIEWAAAKGFAVVALGQRILRTETAPIAALAILQHKFGDM